MKTTNKGTELVGKIAVITGGLGLLGYQHCRALLALGAQIVIWDNTMKHRARVFDLLSAEFPDSIITIQEVDISNEESVIAASTVHILINNAAVNPKYENLTLPGNRLENMTLKDWNFQIGVGLTGAFLCSKYLGQKMATARSGIIVNIASDLSVIAPDQRLYRKNGKSEELQSVKPITYSVIKTGLIGLTRYLATYWAEQGVRINALSPGGVHDNESEEFRDQLESRIPMARMANQDEYIGAIQFLCTDSSSYMTGQNLIVDGGRSVW